MGASWASGETRLTLLLPFRTMVWQDWPLWGSGPICYPSPACLAPQTGAQSLSTTAFALQDWEWTRRQCSQASSSRSPSQSRQESRRPSQGS